jgi:hypothetical protein
VQGLQQLPMYVAFGASSRVWDVQVLTLAHSVASSVVHAVFCTVFSSQLHYLLT